MLAFVIMDVFKDKSWVEFWRIDTEYKENLKGIPSSCTCNFCW